MILTRLEPAAPADQNKHWGLWTRVVWVGASLMRAVMLRAGFTEWI